MTNAQSKEYWTMYSSEIFVGTVLYGLLYFCIGWKARKHNLLPNDCLQFSSNVGSTINAILVVLFSIFWFIHKRWKEKVVSNPRMNGHQWCFLTSYMIADALLLLLHYLRYPANVISRRYMLILHHIVAGGMMFLVEYPNPFYCWNATSIVLIGELSTIFLNLQWFAMYFGNKTLKKYFQVMFVISWFLVRLPAIGYLFWYMVHFRDRILNEAPIRVAISTFTLISLITAIQIPWTAVIILKIIKHVMTKKNPNATVPHLDGMSNQ
eukprot:129829_1